MNLFWVIWPKDRTPVSLHLSCRKRLMSPSVHITRISLTGGTLLLEHRLEAPPPSNSQSWKLPPCDFVNLYCSLDSLVCLLHPGPTQVSKEQNTRPKVMTVNHICACEHIIHMYTYTGDGRLLEAFQISYELKYIM